MLKEITLKEYVDNIGRAKIANQLGVSEEAVYYWTRYLTAPRPHLAHRLIKKSKGLLSWSSIYDPFVKNNIEAQLNFDFVNKG